MDNIAVELVGSSDTHILGEFTLWESSPDNADQVRLELTFPNGLHVADADSFFDALKVIRTALEFSSLRPQCLGAREDVYPSPMILSTGGGIRAYRLKLGCHAKMERLVEIFDRDPDCEPVSVETQEAFYHKWLKSLK